jgi:hypothetical protein
MADFPDHNQLQPIQDNNGLIAGKSMLTGLGTPMHEAAQPTHESAVVPNRLLFTIDCNGFMTITD